MRVYLCRHAKASPGEPDELRELTPAGVEQARALGAALADRDDPPVLVLSSPLARARQTAEQISRVTHAPLRVSAHLAPGATVELLAEALAGLSGPVAVVGHQPDCSEIAFLLTGRDPGFPLAGMIAVELEA